MTTGREAAIKDLSGALAPTVLGQTVTLDGEERQVIKRTLTVEETTAIAGPRFDNQGLAMEGVRITVDQDALGYRPAFGNQMTLNGSVYTVGPVAEVGNCFRITLTRYLR